MGNGPESSHQRVLAEQEALQPLKIGSSDGLLVGQQVYAIGNPFGLDHTLTTGVISGTGREIESGGTGRPIQVSSEGHPVDSKYDVC